MYQLIETLADGHRLFVTLNKRGGILIADESGRWPHETDDGELWLDMTRPLVIDQEDLSGAPITYCMIPLRDEDGLATRTPTNPATILRLAALFGWRIQVGSPGSYVTYEGLSTVAWIDARRAATQQEG
jgi:hypothetical protein